MRKQYVISFRNQNMRLSQAVRYLLDVRHGYPNKTLDINQAAVFATKAEARTAIVRIGRNNLYNTEVSIIEKRV